jgi:general secretion pathway protein C
MPGRVALSGPQGASPIMKNLDQFIGKARVVPYFKGGEPYGFRVSNLGSDAKAYGLGVRAGDIIRSVNGVPVRTPEDAFKAYQDFQNEPNVQMELERNGQSVTVSVPMNQLGSQ